MENVSNLLPRASTPESVGVKSGVWEAFIKDLNSQKLNMHSMLVLRHGKVASECYWYPYKPEIPMAMFSFSKGVTATAIGIAISEGLLSLNDKICDYFPHDCGNKKDNERHAKVTVYDLITHRSGKTIPILYDSEENRWDEFWLNAPYKDEPGTKFRYISENTYMLSKLLTKLTGQTVVEFLTPRLFEPLKIETSYWECDHDGANAGGWGSFLKLEDMAKIGQCYLQNGKWEGKQLIPTEWIADAIQPHVNQIPSIFEKDVGYGYQIFVQKELHTFSFNGLYGQFVVVFPEYDAVFACTSGECDELNFITTLNKYLPAAFTKDEALPENPAAVESLAKELKKAGSSKAVSAARNSVKEKQIENHIMKIKKEHPYASIMGPSTSFMLSEKSGRIDNLSFKFEKDKIIFTFCEHKCEPSTLEIGLGNEFLFSETTLAGIKLHVASHATWDKKGRLVLDLIPLELAQERVMTFTINGSDVHIKSCCTPNFYELFCFYLMFNGVKPILPIRGVLKIAGGIIGRMFDPNYKGKIV